jgi:hypothetical protein
VRGCGGMLYASVCECDFLCALCVSVWTKISCRSVENGQSQNEPVAVGLGYNYSTLCLVLVCWICLKGSLSLLLRACFCSSCRCRPIDLCKSIPVSCIPL